MPLLQPEPASQLNSRHQLDPHRQPDLYRRLLSDLFIDYNNIEHCTALYELYLEYQKQTLKNNSGTVFLNPSHLKKFNLFWQNYHEINLI